MTTINEAVLGTTPVAKSTSASASLAGDFDSFLKLLVSQIENQDPLKPMDSTEFVSQTATLSQVEQAVQTNANLENLASLMTMSGLVSDAGFIGRNVAYKSDAFNLENGGSNFGFELARSSDDVTVQVLAEDGTLIREIPMGIVPGGEIVDVSWDGKDSQGANMLPGDKFKLKIVDNEGNELDQSETYVKASVQEVMFSESGSSLLLSNGEMVSPGMVSSITS
jgi:flagellar basal-body rod modification protein FlgD